ncbi:MAG: undecaprenyldiphospho-muramoylpentapeptide beta-N-acetylglucosaminyltransferase [Candidatus Bipolaricaulota bacterium]|nr:undecaprenyldiphospho-muramoylpentapeptide beta-N-acetylglucosaminyltransferase [Candidatus Bipolaricaulota bacterium]MDW8151956.1 undecaprenyldiphospho-muramoylpentapeptide beta-N-acetylglucosaminyltransferase [Candidatus Bipolaricaulota bacterium]
MRVMVAAGGSGGHVFPALAVLEELRAQGALRAAGWIGRPGGLEERVLEKRPWVQFFPLPSRGLPRDRPWLWPLALGADGLALLRARRLLRAFRPQVLLAMGGYAAVAPALAAKALGIPVAVHEQNAQMGLANRALARVADAVLLAFPGTAGCPRAARVRVTGNPVRPEIAAVPKELGTELLVLGGSLGSRRLVEAVLQAAPELAALPGLRLRLVVGRAGDPQGIAAELRRRGLEAEALAFTEGMAELLGRARLVLARAGASTLAELACAGRPAVLVPWEGAAGGHQLRNAAYFAARGAAVLVRERDLPARLAGVVAELWSDPARLLEMAAAARALAQPEAARRVAQTLRELAKGKEIP